MLALLLLTLDLFSPQAGFWYEHLLAEGGYGRLQRERAAFLIREADGGLTLEMWPESGFRHATYRGSVPSRAIAVLHTHPKEEPRPSSRDRALAVKLRMPVVVITPDAVVAAMPDAREVIIRGEKTPGLVSGTSRGLFFRRTSPRR